jgi:putative transposase
MIITLENAKEYPKIISCFKRYFSQKCHTKYTQHIRQSHSRLKHGYNAVWQKRYYEHTIRNIKDYEEKQHYIYNNPIKHGYVNNIQEWKYSSLRP